MAQDSVNVWLGETQGWQPRRLHVYLENEVLSKLGVEVWVGAFMGQEGRACSTVKGGGCLVWGGWGMGPGRRWGALRLEKEAWAVSGSTC